jgi:flavorubredoxin
MLQSENKMPSDEDRTHDDAVEVGEGIYWVGFYDREASFHCNPYLLLDGDDAVMFDPGSVNHFPIVARKAMALTDLGRISTIVLHHQDPDLCGGVPVLEEVIGRDDLLLVCHSRSGVFIRYYGVTSRLYHVDEHNYTLQLASGRTLQFAFTPYLHSPGAIVTFDGATRTLFSSDIFGSFSAGWDLWATEAYLPRMAEFHSQYMPPGPFLGAALDRIEAFGPEMIAPQHGSVIKGDLVPRALAALRETATGRALEGQGVPR